MDDHGVDTHSLTIDGDSDLSVLEESGSEWTKVRLGDLASRSFGGGTPSTKEPEFWDGSIPWITTAVMNPSDSVLRRSQRNITSRAVDETSTNLAPKGSVLIGTRVGVGKAVVASFDVAINQDITAVVPTENVLPEFLTLCLKQRAIQRWFTENRRGTTIKGVPRSDLLNLEIDLPPLPQQQAIAHALHSVQQAMEAAEAVIAATRELKKSLMRHLFTYGPVPVADADQVPLKETEVGQVPEQWIIKSLGEIATIASGGTPSRKVADYWDGDIPWVKTGEVNYTTITSTEEFITARGFDESSARMFPSGTLLMAMYGQGVTRGRVAVLGIDAAINQACAAITPDARASTRYLYHLFTFHYDRIRNLGHGANQKNLSALLLKSVPVPLPPIFEQQLIVCALDAADRKIEVEEKRKSALEVTFTSLLHPLMTGKARVADLDIAVVAAGGG